MKRASIKMVILLPVLAALIVGVTVMVFVVGMVVSSSTSNLTEELIDARIKEYANDFMAFSNQGYAIAQTMAPIVESIRERGDEDARHEIVTTLSDILMSDEAILSLWTGWEPNAFDGRDSEFVYADAYHNETGRFMPYLFKDGGSVTVEPLSGIDDPVDGLYYHGASDSGKPYVTDPYLYDLHGTVYTLYSIAIPIMEGGRVLGVVGVDYNMAGIIDFMNSATILGDGFMSMVAPDGSFASDRDSAVVMQNYKNTWLSDYSASLDEILANGGSFSTTAYSDAAKTEFAFLGSSVVVGNTDRNWAVCGFVPLKTVNAVATNLVWLIIGIGVALILIVGLITLFLISRNLRKLPEMTAIAEKIAKGHISFDNLSSDDSIKTKNEIALLERAFGDISNSIKDQSNIMAVIAGGDYSVSIPLRSDEDIMNQSINKMIDQTNTAMHEIQSSAAQVSVGSKQIADGAQSLAQGSTEQASSIEELSAAISEIDARTKENAATAEKNSRLSESIRGSAEKGSQQMDEMIVAVNDINDASNSISKIIKTIDDIAFQTNILALNAAVEAARAGQAGKGFAVVAEEVRNLASKSAEAAKETGNMIQNSMEKAELGTRIAGETAESLKEIVIGINESSHLIAEIAISSKEQASGISHINLGIGQVMQVVQQNSATAEESAAASEEMSGQSDMLQQLIAQFKLKAGY